MFRVAKLVGASASGRWAQVHTFFPDKERQELGGLVAAVGVFSSKEGLDLASFGTEAIKRLHEEYYGKVGVGSLKRLGGALEQVKAEFGQIEMAIAAGVFLDGGDGRKVMYAGVLGEARVELWRDEKLINLLSSNGKIEVLSGYLREKDLVILGTKVMFRLIDKAVLVKALQLGKASLVVDQLAPAVHSQDSSLAAGVVVEVGGDMEPETVEVDRIAVKGELDLEAPRKTARFWVARWLMGFWQKLNRASGCKNLAREKVYVIGVEKKRQRLVATVAGALLVLLVVSVGFGVVRQRTSEEAKVLRELQEQVERRISESQELNELNPLRARKLLVEAREVIETYRAEGQLRSKKIDAWLEETDKELSLKLADLLRVYELDKAEVFLDLNLVREGTVGEMMDFDGEELLVLDRQSEVVLAVGVDDKKSGVVGGGDLLEGASLAGVYFGRGFVLSSRGVVELDLRRKTSAVVIELDDYRHMGALDVFGGNIYLLDKERGQIYRFRGREGGFGSRQEWLATGVEPDFSKVVSMAIDGSIWVLTASGKLEQYSQGTGVAVEITGLDVELKDPRAIYTDEDSEWLYILDRGNSRVVVVNKQGEYVAQYRWEGLGEASDLAVSEEAGKMLVLSGSTIYEISLK